MPIILLIVCICVSFVLLIVFAVYKNKKLAEKSKIKNDSDLSNTSNIHFELPSLDENH
jgi:uncharacterized membrane protein